MNKNTMRMQKHLKTMKNELNRVENITNRYGTRNSKRSFYFRKQVELTEKLLKTCPNTKNQDLDWIQRAYTRLESIEKRYNLTSK